MFIFRFIILLFTLASIDVFADTTVRQIIGFYAGDVSTMSRQAQNTLGQLVLEECGSLGKAKVSDVEIVLKSKRSLAPGEAPNDDDDLVKVTSKLPQYPYFKKASVYFGWYPEVEVKATVKCP